MSKNKALFMGKFQPPHLGHIQTILSIAESYDKVIVGITKGSTKVLDYEEVAGILESVLKYKGNIDIKIIEGTIEGGDADLSDLNFDVIVSGNRKVLEIMKKEGYEVAFQPRTKGVGYSGSELRNVSKDYKNLSLMEKPQLYQFELIELSNIKPLEKILPSHYKNIEELILKDGVIKKPLIVDSKYNIVLDGSHRYAFLLKHGFKFAPVVKVNYEDDAIFVGNRLRHRFLKDDDFVISKAEVISRGVNENLFDARTTRHFFPFRKVNHVISLDELIRGKENDISYLIEDINVEQEILKDMNYINEIDNEINVIKEYLKEQMEVKEYLQYQIDEIKKRNV